MTLERVTEMGETEGENPGGAGLRRSSCSFMWTLELLRKKKEKFTGKGGPFVLTLP